jgi:hypothetical protein
MSTWLLIDAQRTAYPGLFAIRNASDLAARAGSQPDAQRARPPDARSAPRARDREEVRRRAGQDRPRVLGDFSRGDSMLAPVSSG